MFKNVQTQILPSLLLLQTKNFQRYEDMVCGVVRREPLSVAPGGLVCIGEWKADVSAPSHQWKDSRVGNDIP